MTGESVKAILTIDRNQRNLELLGQFLGKAGYQTLAITSLEELERVLSEPNPEQRFGLALVDISGFDQRIWQYCAGLQTNNIPLLVVSPKQSMAIQQESLLHGAKGTLVKPLVVRDLLKLVTAMMNNNKA